jgi:hypothetical protein
MVPLSEIRAKGLELAISRYSVNVTKPTKLESPRHILARLRALEELIGSEVDELEALLP